ncbi:hypothetical protein BV22DRAFT_993851, partial [Leucogyrophana mollusca]
VRLASTDSSGTHGHARFPFPLHPRPTPHQIFHLPLGASQADIKGRYYDLVRMHHPDSAHTRNLPPSERHARFQAITAAYETLCGKGKFHTHGNAQDYEMHQQLRRRRASMRRRAGMDYDFDFPHHHHPHGKEWTASADERWKDWTLVTVAMVFLAVGLGHIFMGPITSQRHLSAANNLAQARSEAREFGMERRREIRKRVREYQLAKEVVEEGEE